MINYKITNTQPLAMHMISNYWLIILYNWKLYKTTLYGQKLYNEQFIA